MQSFVACGGFDPADYARRIAAIFAEDRIVDYVRAKPIQSLLMAAAAGFVLSSIVRR